MSRGRDSDYEPSAPYYPEQNVFGPNNPYAQVPPSSPFLASDPSLPDLRTPPQRFVSSPLKPRAAGGDRTASTPPRDTSWIGFGPNDRGQDYPNSPEGSSRSSHAEKEQMKGILAGNVGGSFTPYPSLVRVSQSQSSSRTPSQSLILPPPHNRFSSRSSDCHSDQREMLEEYFSLVISENGKVESLPILLKNYTPNLDRLPLFLMRLGPQANWTSEKECFESFLRELAFFHSPGPVVPDSPSPNDASESDAKEDGEVEKSERWQIEHVVMPAVREYLIPPKSMVDVGNGNKSWDGSGSAVVASLPDLYRVFERC